MNKPNNKDREIHETGAVFNMGLATLQRMDRLLQRINEPAEFFDGHHALTSLYCEIHPFLNEEECSEAERLRENYMASCKWTHKENDTVFQWDKKARRDFELWLRTKMMEKGLLMAKADDPGEALGGM